MIFKLFRVSVILALGVSSTQAGFLGEEGEIAAVDPVYGTENAPDSISEVLTILNARGMQGFQFRGLTTLNNATPTLRTTLFVDDQADSDTYRYEAPDTEVLPADFLAQLKERGEDGFEYVVNFNGERSVNIYEKRIGSSETFDYRLPESPTTLSGFLSLVEMQGASGYEWLGLRSLRNASGQLVRHQLFIKRSSDTGTYTYSSGDSDSDGNTSINQYNSQGSAGFRWIARTTIPGAFTTHNIYVNSSTRSSTFFYNIEDGAGSRAEFINQADAQGGLGRYFKTTGTYNRNGTAGAASIYVNEMAVLPSAGEISFARNGDVMFTPLESGSFQLQASINLQSWADSGVAQAGTAGVAITFNPGVPVGRRFFRVVSP